MVECHVGSIYKRNAFLVNFEAILRFWLKKSSFSTGFTRVSVTRFLLLRNLVFIGFIRFFDMAEGHVRFIYKRNAFLIILEAFLGFGLKKSSFSTGFIRVFATRFWLLRNIVFRWFYKAFRRFENALRKPCLGNAF